MKTHSLAALQSALKDLGVTRKDRGVVLDFRFLAELTDQRQLDLFSPGCGSPTFVPGTNGGQMPCGGQLTWLDGSTTQQFCAYCDSQINAPAVVRLSECPVPRQGHGRDGLVAGPV